MPNSDESPRRITLEGEGPLLVEGPVEVTCADGTVAVSDRFVVALCTCRRSRIPPWCDTSHRRRVRRDSDGPAAENRPSPPRRPLDRD